MSEAIKFFDGLVGEMTHNIHTCMLGKINKFDHKKMEAEVILLHKRRLSNGESKEYPIIYKVPVAFFYANDFFIRPPYKKGDLVVVVFADSEIDKILMSGEKESSNSERRHALTDAIVIGGWNKPTDELPISDANSNDMVISNKDTSFSIVIQKDGAIEFKSNKSIDIKSDEGVTISGPTQTSSWE